MTEILHPNDGQRPSRLLLARFHSGECGPEERARVEAWIAEHGPGWLTELDTLAVPALDLPAIRARAGGGEVVAFPGRWRAWAPMMALAAAALLVAVPAARWSLGPEAPEAPEVRWRGPGFEVHRLEQGALVPYRGEALGAGDVIAFRLPPGPARELVLLSVDGGGAVSVFYPSEGDAPFSVAASPGAAVALPGSLTLDGAPGPEIFVAAEGLHVAEARARVAAAWEAAGAAGVRERLAADPALTVVEVQRR